MTVVAALSLMLSFGLACARAQTATESSASSAAPAPETKLALSELRDLVAPIALYPDVLVAQILPAATFPTDVVMAARWLRSNPDMAELDKKPWDESVKTLCHYSSVLFKLDEDLDWTNALGAAFLAQGEEMMSVIQDGRERARTRGMLETNAKQTIVVEEETIRIVPTQAEVVYVPQYNPEVIYVDSGVSAGTATAVAAVSFGTGWALGAWLNMDCNWHGHNVYYCQAGYWGGWPHRGVVAWGDNWAAGVGPRRAFAVGDERGVVVGPHGGAAWGPNGGAVWRRPPGPKPMPVYGGRYAAYGAPRGAAYGARNVTNNQINVNRNINNSRNANIDRGDRTNVAGGPRGPAMGGDRPRPSGGADRSSRPPSGMAQQLPANTPPRPATPSNRDYGGADRRPSAFNTGGTRPQVNQYGQRGQQSRDVARPAVSPQRPAPASPPRSQIQPSRPSSSPPRSSAFSSGQSRGQVGQYSSRGAMSRGGGGGRMGGGRR